MTIQEIQKEDLIMLEKWKNLVNDILQMTSRLELQDEKDKNSISLIGLKENPQPQTLESKQKQIISMDSKCVNCSNNANAVERSILYS